MAAGLTVGAWDAHEEVVHLDTAKVKGVGGTDSNSGLGYKTTAQVDRTCQQILGMAGSHVDMEAMAVPLEGLLWHGQDMVDDLACIQDERPFGPQTLDRLGTSLLEHGGRTLHQRSHVAVNEHGTKMAVTCWMNSAWMAQWIPAHSGAFQSPHLGSIRCLFYLGVAADASKSHLAACGTHPFDEQ